MAKTKMTAEQALEWLVGQVILSVDKDDGDLTLGFKEGYIYIDGDFDISISPENPK